MNGTFVNGRPVKREAPLAVGDVLRVGDAEYRLSPVGAGPAAGESGVIAVAPSLSEPADLSDEQTVTGEGRGGGERFGRGASESVRVRRARGERWASALRVFAGVRGHGGLTPTARLTIL